MGTDSVTASNVLTAKSLNSLDRSAISRVIDSGKAMNAHAFVEDALNDGVVRILAFKYLVTLQRVRKRELARKTERKSIRTAITIADVNAEGFSRDNPVTRDIGRIMDGSASEADHSGRPMAKRVASEYSHARLKLEKELEDRLHARVSTLISSIKEDFIVEWTEELLASTFRVDGEDVSWAVATVEQHNARIFELSGQAAGTLRTIAMHEKAVAEILAAGVANMGEVLA